MKRVKRDTTDWHVTVRGARRLLLFRDDEDFQTFYGLLAEALKRTGARLHAQCLLSNHAHLSPRASSPQLTDLMYRTEQPYSRFHNRKYRLSGHTYDRPYFNEEIRTPRVLTFISRYIHLNPVRSGLATRPERYPWSSAGEYLGDAEGPIRVDPFPTLRQFSQEPDAARAAYGDFVQRDLRQPRALPRGGWSAMDLWQEEFRWILETVRPKADRLAPMTPEAVAAWIGVQVGVPPRAIGSVLGAFDGRAVSRAVYEFGKSLSEKPELETLIAELGIL